MNTEATVTPINNSVSTKKRQIPTAPFQMCVRDVQNPHNFQLVVDYGSQPGPWLAIAINDKVYCAGYLPKQKRSRKGK